MGKQVWGLSLLVAGCTTLAPTLNQERELLVYPRLAPQTQALILPNTIASIATLDIIPYLETTPGTYAPISSLTGNTTTVGAADMLKLSQSSPSIDPSRPFVLRKLKPNKNYRIYGRAYNPANTQISLDASSFVDVAVGQDDAPGMATLPVNLTDTPFGANTSVRISTTGRYDYLKGTLYLVAGNAQVALVQSTRNNPEFAFSNLQGNTNYRLVAEAYKLGAMMASNSLDINIGNENAPASLSMSLTIPYVTSSLAGSGSASFGDGIGNEAGFNTVTGTAIDPQGNLYITDYGNNRIRKVTQAGVVATIVGDGSSGFLDGTGTLARINRPYDIAVDNQGNLYIADYYNHRIRKVSPAGVVSTLAGNGTSGFADGTGMATMFNRPSGITTDSLGNVYVTDRGNNCIRKITTTGIVTTIAGDGTIGLKDGPALQARFNEPIGIATDASNNIYVTDWANHCIRKLSGGTVSTLAGTGATGFADGTGTSAVLNYPLSLTLDLEGNIYFSDWENHRIRKLTTTGVVTTIAGNGSAAYTEGIGTSAMLNRPWGIEIDAMGNLYVADENNHRIRKLQ